MRNKTFINKAGLPRALVFCFIISLNGCSTAKPELKVGTYKMTTVPPRQMKANPESHKECVIQSDLDSMKAYPGPVPRSVPTCGIRNYRINGNRVSYEQLCIDNNHMAGGDMVIYWDFLFNDEGYEGTMRGRAPKDSQEMQTRIRAEYLKAECEY